MKLSPVEEYGIRCLIQLAGRVGQQPTTIRMISEAEGLSTAYVGKLMFLLQRAHLVQATRGVQGGYALVKPPRETSLEEVFLALDPQDMDALCEKFSGQEDQCVHLAACNLKRVLSGMNEHINTYLRRYTLADLAGQPLSPVSQV